MEFLTCLERRHEAGRRDGRDERRQAGRGLREGDDVLLGEGEVGRDHCSGDAAAGGREAGVRAVSAAAHTQGHYARTPSMMWRTPLDALRSARMTCALLMETLPPAMLTPSV